MGIISEELYTVQCDNCKDNYQDEDSGYAWWMMKSDAWECANSDGWTVDLTDLKNEKYYCPRCHDYNDEDELDINFSRTFNSKKLTDGK